MGAQRTLVLSSLALLLCAGGLTSLPQTSRPRLGSQGKRAVERAGVLLHQKDQASRWKGVDLARREFLVDLLPDLKNLQRMGGLSPKLLRVLRLAIQELEHYRRMRVPAGVGSSTSLPPRPRLREGVLPPLHRVRLLCVDRSGVPIPGARVRAFCRDYDLFLPFDGFATCDAKGAIEISLPEGKWTFVAGASPKGTPSLILLPQVPITSSKTLLLFPEVQREWRMGKRDGFQVRRLYLRHPDYPQLTLPYEIQGREGKVEVTKASLNGWVQGESKTGAFVMGGGSSLRFDPSKLVPLKVQFGNKELKATEVQVRLIGRDPSPRFHFSIQKTGEVLWCPRKSLDLGYAYSIPTVGRLEFGLRPFRWKGHGKVWLGTPLRPWVWHLVYSRRYRGAPPYSFQIFFRDPQDRLLQTFSPEKGRKVTPVSVRISKGGRYWLWVRRLRNFRIDLKESLLPEMLDDLDYEIQTPFPIVGKTQTGHHSTRFRSKHYNLTGPALLAPEIRNFLGAAEVLFKPIRSVGLRPLPWLRGRIVFHPTMPRGVRAYSSVRGNSNFNTRDLARCVRLADALRRTPIMHEHLHTVGYKHSDFMDVAGFRLRKKLFPIGSRGQGGELGRRGRAYTNWFLGKGKPFHKKAILRALLARFGGIAFDAFLQRRGDRSSLEARGLTEEEAKAVLFSRILGRELFSWFGVSPARSKNLEALIQPKASETPPPALTGPDPKNLMARMQVILGKASKNSKGPRDPNFQTLLRDLQKLPTQRSRIRTALRLGAKARAAKRISLAYPCFRTALQVATKMGSRIFTRTRRAAIEVCLGKPLHLGWL